MEAMPARRHVQTQSLDAPSALLYLRVSSEDQAREGTSLDAQLAECRHYALRHEWVIEGEYTDVMSGTRDDRPHYQALLDRVRDLRAGRQPVVVVVAALDRFGRRMLERVRCREELKGLGVATHSVREGGEVSDLVANILASVAQEEVARLGMRIRQTWAHLGEQGWRKVGGRGVAWGYRSRAATEDERKDGAPRTVVEPDPVAAPYAREMFDRVARGEATWSITRWAASLPSEVRGGRAMTRRTVQDLLVAPLYAGLVTVDGHRGRWEPIVDAVTFRRVQDRVEGHKRMPRQASGRYLLTGMLRCASCGGRMRGESLKAARYRCGGEVRGIRCSQTADRDRVECFVLGVVGALMDALATDASFQVALRKAWHARQRGQRADNGAKVRQLEATIERSRKRITRATELFVDGTIERGAYDDLVRQARADAETASSALDAARLGSNCQVPDLPPIDEVLNAAGGWATVLQGGDSPAQRDVLGMLIEKAVAVRERPGLYRVDLEWTPFGETLKSLAETAAESRLRD
jgi:site-specific DNA recombinase